MTATSMEAELAENRLLDDGEELGDAWLELANAVCVALERRPWADMAKVERALQRVADLERRAWAEVEEALRIVQRGEAWSSPEGA